MIVEPKVRGFMCATSHGEGCSQNVKNQIEFIKSNPKINGSKKVLIIGASTGYGLASRIASTYSFNASTIGVMFEKEATKTRTATPGWYNTAAFEQLASNDGYYAKTINGDAFSESIKRETIELIKKDLGKVDMVIYSLAAPKRIDKDGVAYSSALKTIGSEFTNKSLDLRTNIVSTCTVPVATESEILSTVKVMGGEDWLNWIDMLVQADAIEDNAITLAYSYIGPKITYPIYWNGTIGQAKKHLYNTSKQINNKFSHKNIKAYISVNKAVVTQASAAIPIVPLYISVLYKIMKEKGTHEGCIEQIYRLFKDKLYLDKPVVDENDMLRVDDYEMDRDTQAKVLEVWEKINSENLMDLADINGYWLDFYNMFGFKVPNVDYNQDIDIEVKIKSLAK